MYYPLYKLISYILKYSKLFTKLQLEFLIFSNYHYIHCIPLQTLKNNSFLLKKLRKKTLALEYKTSTPQNNLNIRSRFPRHGSRGCSISSIDSLRQRRGRFRSLVRCNDPCDYPYCATSSPRTPMLASAFLPPWIWISEALGKSSDHYFRTFNWFCNSKLLSVIVRTNCCVPVSSVR